MSIKKHTDKELLVNIIDAIPSNIFFKDTELKYVFSSHYWDQVDKGSNEEFDIYGKTDRDIRKDTENLDNVEKTDREILETGVGRQYTIKSFIDGHTQYIDIIKEPVRDEAGNVIGIVGLLNDVTRVTAELDAALVEAKRAAQMEADFLANMSHEIRTPMNAVIGMAEMALREDLPPAAREYISQIKSSGNALLNIINDILDFSKIDSGKMDIIPDNYEMLSVMHDVSSVIMTRIADKNIEFIQTINTNLPQVLFGDVMRIRQIIINIANNAVKFTNAGYVHLNVDYEEISDDLINVIIEVSDTGIGIKEEDIGKLFNSFQQLDAKRNRNVEGTGLGLAICSKLLELMDGTIDVTSVYGQGTTFKVTFPQKVIKKEPVITVKNPEEKIVMGYWKDVSGDSFFYEALQKFSVEAYSLKSVDDYETIIKDNGAENKEKYIFTNYNNYISDCVEFAKNHPDIHFIVVCDFFAKIENIDDNISFIKKPFSTMGISTSLNNEKIYYGEESSYEFDFVAPDAKLLIVDDNEVNLAVAEGLLEPLKLQIVKANSGRSALEYIAKEKFDIVLMDHMMPELDGIETTKMIRKNHPELADMPIIALSANAVADAKKMFLSEGMTDFIPKPIEIRTIISKLRQWLPKDKIIKQTAEMMSQTENNAVNTKKLEIGDLDIDAALGLLKNEKLFMTILEKYYSAIESKAKLIKSCELTGDVATYTIEVHALKSASKQIGAMELSGMAAELEAAGNNNDVDMIHTKTDALVERYLGYIDVLKPLFEKEEDSFNKSVASKADVENFLDTMLNAADELDMDAMEEVINNMSNYSYSAEEEELFGSLKEAAANIDVDTIEAIVDSWKALL